MVRSTRRRLLAVGGLAALPGCSVLSGSTTNAPPRSSLDDDLVTALETVPGTVDGTAVGSVSLASYDGPVAGSLQQSTQRPLLSSRSTQSVVRGLGLDRSEVDHVALATFDPAGSRVVVVVTGEFGAEKPVLDRGVPGVGATRREDGRVTLGIDTAGPLGDGPNDPGQSMPWESAITAAKDVVSGSESSVLSDETVRRLVDETAWDEELAVVREPSSGYFPPLFGLDYEPPGTAPRGVGVGTERTDDRTLSVSVVGSFEDGDSVDRAPLKKVGRTIYRTGELDFERDGTVLSATGTNRAVREAAVPDLDFEGEYTIQEKSATFTIRPRTTGSEEVRADSLSVYLAESPVETPWEGTITDGDEVEFAVKSYVPVRIDWTDPDEPAASTTLYAGTSTLPSSKFSETFEPKANRARIQYTGWRNLATRFLEVTYWDGPDPKFAAAEPLSRRHDVLESGDEVVVDGVEYFDEFGLYTSYREDMTITGAYVAGITPRPPDEFELALDDGTRVVYDGESSHPAKGYRITVEGDPALTQFADEYETLSNGDAVEVDAGQGDRVVVEWVDEDDGSEALFRETVS